MALLHCPKCGQEIAVKTAKFCFQCGYRFKRSDRPDRIITITMELHKFVLSIFGLVLCLAIFITGGIVFYHHFSPEAKVIQGMERYLTEGGLLKEINEGRAENGKPALTLDDIEYDIHEGIYERNTYDVYMRDKNGPSGNMIWSGGILSK